MGKTAIFLALFFWGLWGVFPRLAIQNINQQSASIWSAVGSFFVMLIFLCYKRFDLEFNFSGSGYAMLGGLAGTIGGLFYLYAMQKESPVNVVLITSMYPIISVIILAVFLNESLNYKQVLAMFFAVLAVYLCNLES